jgi:hypothetical protein
MSADAVRMRDPTTCVYWDTASHEFNELMDSFTGFKTTYDVR